MRFRAKSTVIATINYRDLSVQYLGSIYERLLKWEVAPNLTEAWGCNQASLRGKRQALITHPKNLSGSSSAVPSHRFWPNEGRRS